MTTIKDIGYNYGTNVCTSNDETQSYG